MKKVATLFFLLLIVVIWQRKSVNLNSVSLTIEEDNNTYKIVEVSLKDNFTDHDLAILNDYKILGLYPKFSSVYETKLPKELYFNFDNMTNFYNWYALILDKYNLKPPNIYKVEGISLKRVRILINSNDFLKLLPKIKSYKIIV